MMACPCPCESAGVGPPGVVGVKGSSSPERWTLSWESVPPLFAILASPAGVPDVTWRGRITASCRAGDWKELDEQAVATSTIAPAITSLCMRHLYCDSPNVSPGCRATNGERPAGNRDA